MANVVREYTDVKAVQLDSLILYEFFGAPNPDGVTEKSLEINLPRNSVVTKYEVVMTAAMAHAVNAGDAGQVRTTNNGGSVTAILDFGTPRTIGAVAAPEGFTIQSISTWIGTEFASPPKFQADSPIRYASLPSEVRTERLQVVLGGNPSTEQIAGGMVLVLPESPSGLEVRIDGATPVFSQTTAVDPSNATEVSATSWNTNSQRVLDLGPALAKLTGNPLDETEVKFVVKFTSRVPGQLDLALRPEGQVTQRIRRAIFNGQPQREMAFSSEGKQDLALDSLPSGLTVTEVDFSVLGTPPPERVVPPVGPVPPDPAFAVFTFNPTRAGVMRLPQDARLAEYTGVRVPLAAGDSGAEARVLLWRSKDLDDQSPSQPLDNGSSDSVSMDAGSDDWRTFRWKQSIPAPKDFVLWAAVVVNRGEATMTFGNALAGAGAEPFLWGATSGPWHDLPQALTAAQARGRVRLMGKTKPDTPFPPVEIALGTTFAPVVPNPKGTPAVLEGGSVTASGPVTLSITSYAAAQITLREIDVISTS